MLTVHQRRTLPLTPAAMEQILHRICCGVLPTRQGTHLLQRNAINGSQRMIASEDMPYSEH